MIEKYIELRMLTDYIIPVFILILMIACGLFLLFFKRMCDFHNKRNKWIYNDEGEEEMTQKECNKMRKKILQEHESELKNLKPCPLCHEKNIEISFDGVDKESKLVNISCKNEICRKNGFGHIGTIETVINAWNKYAEQTTQQIAGEKELWKDYVEHP